MLKTNPPETRRSPLKARPLRLPGQSLDEQLRDFVDQEIIVLFIMGVFAVLFVALEWYRWLTATPPMPFTYSILGLSYLAYATVHIRRAWLQAQRMKLGRDGERAVGQYLDELRDRGHRVFHDLIGEGFNVDHVIVGRKGIFTVETKTFSKPVDKKAVVRFENDHLTVNGFPLDRNPLEQARAQAKWLQEVLHESTGRVYPVRPVVLFPGWWVETMRNRQDRHVWVLNPKALPTFMQNEPDQLKEEDLRLATYHLCRFIRTTPS